MGVEEWMGQEYMWKSIDRVKRVKAPNPIHVYCDFINPLSSIHVIMELMTE